MRNKLYILFIMLMTHCWPAIADATKAQQFKCWKQGQFSLLEPKEVSLEFGQYYSLRDTYLAPVDEDIKRSGAFITNFDIVRWGAHSLYMDNTLHFDQSERTGQIVHAGWKFEVGARVARWGFSGIDVFYQHHSRHILEDVRPTGFPVMDRYGVRLIIFKP